MLIKFLLAIISISSFLLGQSYPNTLTPLQNVAPPGFPEFIGNSFNVDPINTYSTFPMYAIPQGAAFPEMQFADAWTLPGGRTWQSGTSLVRLGYPIYFRTFCFKYLPWTPNSTEPEYITHFVINFSRQVIIPTYMYTVGAANAYLYVDLNGAVEVSPYQNEYGVVHGITQFYPGVTSFVPRAPTIDTYGVILSIPNDPSLVGISVTGQFVRFETYNLYASNAVRVTIL